jgi:hypothetical protein
MSDGFEIYPLKTRSMKTIGNISVDPNYGKAIRDILRFSEVTHFIIDDRANIFALGVNKDDRRK